jgi:hypothetical protein
MAARGQQSSICTLAVALTAVVATAAAVWWYKTRNDPTAQKKGSLQSYLVTLQTLICQAANVSQRCERHHQGSQGEAEQRAEQSIHCCASEKKKSGRLPSIASSSSKQQQTLG